MRWLPSQRPEALEDRVDMTGVRLEIEDRVELDPRRDRVIAADELAEVALLLPRLHGVPLHEPVRLVAAEPRLDERQQQPLAEEEAVARVEVPLHPLGEHAQALDQPGESVEHVVEREE